MAVMKMVHERDPAAVVREKVGDLSKFEIFGNLVLIGTYERPEKTKGGIILSEKTRDEEMNQGKAGLVLAMGPAAFQSDQYYDFRGQAAKIGDWVSIFVMDGRQIKINGHMCRLVEDQHIRMRIPDPDSIY